jgi:hypothetical protein
MLGGFHLCQTLELAYRHGRLSPPRRPRAPRTPTQIAGVPEGAATDILGYDKSTMTDGPYSGGASLKVKAGGHHREADVSARGPAGIAMPPAPMPATPKDVRGCSRREGVAFILRCPATPEEPPCPDPRSTTPRKSATKPFARVSVSTTRLTARPSTRPERSAQRANERPSRRRRRRPRRGT